MRRKNPRQSEPLRKNYVAPELTRVRLVPDEAVLASCKNGATAGPAGAAKKCAGAPGLCSHNAS